MSTSDPNELIDAHVEAARGLESRYAEVSWRLATGDAGSVQALAEAATQLRRLYADPKRLDEIRALRARGGLDAGTHRQLEILDNAYSANQLSPDALERISALEASVEDRFTRFRGHLRGEAVGDNELRDVLLHGDDVDLRQDAWEASKEVGREVADDVLALVRLRNAEARRLGYADFYAMSLKTQELDHGWLFATLERLEEETRAPFQWLKARLDRQIARRFKIPESAPLRPWHYADAFFQALPPDEDGVSLDPLFADLDTVELGRRFYANIGLPVDDILDSSDLFERPGKEQHAFCTRLDREGDVRVLANLRQDEGWTSILLHELGHAAYDKGLPMELPWLLRDVSHPLTTEAVALMMERMTRHGPWLRSMLGIADEEARRLGAHSARALADGQLIFCRWCLVMVHFEQALYADPEQDLDSLWWQLVERFQGIAPPPGRAAPDWAAKVHIACAPVYYQNYIVGELVASQLWHHLIRRVVGDAADPGAALVEDARVGRFFTQQVFNPGATMPWMRHVAQATAEPLNPAYYGALVRGGAE